MKLYFLTPDGQRIEAEAEPGETLMQAATAARVPGVLGDCGGGCSCGTCHLLLPQALAAELATHQPASAMERELIVHGEGYCPQTSRLGCQVRLSADMARAEFRVVAG